MTNITNIFAIGNVLDPHVRIEGKCRACQGKGCAECNGEGTASALVRLSEIVTPLAAEFVGTAGEADPENYTHV